jgi:hypothetical protein
VRDVRPADEALHATVNRALARFCSMAPVFAHYREATVRSATARTGWVDRDRLALPF